MNFPLNLNYDDKLVRQMGLWTWTSNKLYRYFKQNTNIISIKTQLKMSPAKYQPFLKAPMSVMEAPMFLTIFVKAYVTADITVPLGIILW